MRFPVDADGWDGRRGGAAVFAVAFALALASAGGRPAVARGSCVSTSRSVAGMWADGLGDLACVSAGRHLKLVKTGGVTIDPAEQAWSLPGAARFSAGTIDPTVEITASGTGREEVVLWSRIREPGQGLEPASACAPRGSARCLLDPKVSGVVNGLVHRRGLSGYPYLPRGQANAAGWDTLAGAPRCATTTAAVMGGISSFAGSPVLRGGTGPLAAGALYAASFSVSADHGSSDAEYAGFDFYNPVTGGAEPGGWTIRESELGGPLGTAFGEMTHVTVTMKPSEDGSRETRVLAKAGAPAHCTLLGPVYVTAQEGAWGSPVFDALSDRTAWTRIEWEMDQSSVALDPSCACATPGSPLTPVEIAFEIGPSEPAVCARRVPAPAPDRGRQAIPADATGRYLRFCAVLHGRETAAAVAPLLAPRDPHLHFSGWRPVLKRISAFYYARAAEASSRLVAPASFSGWTSVTWEGETPGKSSIVVDVLAEDGTVLFPRIPREFAFAGGLDPFRYPAVRLRASLSCDPADPGNRPVLRRWGVEWKTLAGRLTLDRTAFAPAKAERVSGLAVVERGGRVRVRVHDTAGRTVATLFNAETPARAAAFAWDGRGTDGKPAKPGTYLVTATTPAGAGSRKVRVLE